MDYDGVMTILYIFLGVSWGFVVLLWLINFEEKSKR